MNTVHDEAQASGLEAGYGLWNEDSRVERDGSGERFAVRSHAGLQVLLLCVGSVSPRIDRDATPEKSDRRSHDYHGADDHRP